MNEFDEKYYDRLVREQRYGEVANYLSNFQFYDINKQEELDKNIEYFKRQDKIRTSLINRAVAENPADINIPSAINFTSAFNSGAPIDYNDNSYGTKFSEYLRKLGSTKSDEAKGLSIQMNQEAYDNFLNATGYNEENFKDLNIEKANTNKGNVEIKFAKNNPNISSILQGLKNATSTTLGYYALPGGGVSFGYNKTVSFIDIYGLSDDGTYLKRENYNGNLSKLLNVADEAVSKSDKAINSALKNHNYTSGVTIYGVLGKGQVELKRKRDMNLITDTEYGNRVKELEQEYNLILSGNALTQYSVYANDPSSGTETMQELNNIDRAVINGLLKRAIVEKRVQYRAASSDGVDGTYITILPKTSTKDDIKYKELVKGTKEFDTRAGYYLFVPGLFSEAIDETINSNTKNKTLREIADMKKWMIDYDTRDGDKIYPTETNNFILKTKEGNLIIDQATAQSIINEDKIKRDVIKGLNREANKGATIESLENIANLSAYGAISEKYDIRLLNPDGTKVDVSSMSENDKRIYNNLFTEADVLRNYFLSSITKFNQIYTYK